MHKAASTSQRSSVWATFERSSRFTAVHKYIICIIEVEIKNITLNKWVQVQDLFANKQSWHALCLPIQRRKRRILQVLRARRFAPERSDSLARKLARDIHIFQTLWQCTQECNSVRANVGQSSFGLVLPLYVFPLRVILPVAIPSPPSSVAPWPSSLLQLVSAPRPRSLLFASPAPLPLVSVQAPRFVLLLPLQPSSAQLLVVFWITIFFFILIIWFVQKLFNWKI